MNTINPSKDVENQSSRKNLRNPQIMRFVQILGRVVTLIFLVALAWAIYQAVVNGNALPVWAWLGVAVLFAAALGLGVAVVVYRGVAGQVGPSDYRSFIRVTGELKNETKHVEVGGANSLRADIKIVQGVLQLMAGATEVMDADLPTTTQTGSSRW